MCHTVCKAKVLVFEVFHKIQVVQRWAAQPDNQDYILLGVQSGVLIVCEVI